MRKVAVKMIATHNYNSIESIITHLANHKLELISVNMNVIIPRTIFIWGFNGNKVFDYRGKGSNPMCE
jgi:hypothetical protein